MEDVVERARKSCNADSEMSVREPALVRSILPWASHFFTQSTVQCSRSATSLVVQYCSKRRVSTMTITFLWLVSALMPSGQILMFGQKAKSQQLGEAEYEAKQNATNEKLRRDNAAAFALHPDKARLSPEFVADARNALKTIGAMQPTYNGVSGYELADQETDLTFNAEGETLGELTISFALRFYLLARYQDEFAVHPAGPLPAPTEATLQQQSACSAALSKILDAAVSPPSVSECDLIEFHKARRR